MNIIKAISVSIVFLLMTVNHLFAQNNADKIIGTWIDEAETRTVEVFKTNGKYSGKIVDAKNKQEIGKLIIWDLQYMDADKEWSDGEVQLPDMSHPANCYVTLKGDKVKITGYHGIRWFGSSQTYSRKK